MTQLHILVDSREQSISYARHFYRRLGQQLGRVEHIRHASCSDRFEKMVACALPEDHVLVSTCFLAEEQLNAASDFLRQHKKKLPEITIVCFTCFEHIGKWCLKYGVHFEENPFKLRILSPSAEARINHFLARNTGALQEEEREALERIWTQYRLMSAIISRSNLLGEVASQLIQGLPEGGSQLHNEFNRAIRYYKMGEHDMAGGTYSCEKASGNGIDQLRARINLIAATDYNVLINGESGSGKETVAWAIHEMSARRDAPFLTINCAGLADELLESEMYGYVKGSHNQAFNDHPGMLEAANGGTIFLDELPEMGPRIQAKFLRMLESGEYRPIGGTENKYTNVRIIAAGQTTLLSDPFRVRRDLLSRISQLSLEILPLRELEKRTPGTLHKIFYVLLERYTWTTVYRNGARYELSPKDIKTYQETIVKEPEKLSKLTKGDWKESNIRQLNNFIRHWLVLGDDVFSAYPALDGKENGTSPTVLLEEPTFNITDDQLKKYLQNLTSREEIQALFAGNPISELKKAYIRHIVHLYEKIIERENQQKGTDVRPTQKELSALIGITEFTLSRYKH
jgi:DNA-binding NtrC family response regulator